MENLLTALGHLADGDGCACSSAPADNLKPANDKRIKDPIERVSMYVSRLATTQRRGNHLG
jgi:hypothetical protein